MIIISKDYFDILKIKSRLIDELCNNKKIFELVDNKEAFDGTDLPWRSIFPYLKISEFPYDAGTYICFRVDNPSLVSSKNRYLENLLVTIYVMSHEEHLQGKFKGTRFDNLAAEVKKLLCGLEGTWIGELECVSDVEDVIDKVYPCRVLKFKTKDISGAYYES